MFYKNTMQIYMENNFLKQLGHIWNSGKRLLFTL